MFQIARGSGATLSECTFSSKKHTSLSKKHTPPKDPKKRYMVSLKKALGRRLFLLGKTWRNKTRLPEFNHEVLGGLSMRDPRDTPQGREI